MFFRDPVAQVVEQRPFKADVEGSSPSWVTFFSTIFSFYFKITILLNIQVLDLNGRIIDTIYDGFIGSGYYIKNWDAVDFPSGIYIVQMNINGFHDSQKVILIK